MRILIKFILIQLKNIVANKCGTRLICVVRNTKNSNVTGPAINLTSRPYYSSMI